MGADISCSHKKEVLGESNLLKAAALAEQPEQILNREERGNIERA